MTRPYRKVSPQSSCHGKQRFDSAKLAHEVVRKRNRNRDKGQRQAYACQFCGGWHIGHVLSRSATDKRERLASYAFDEPMEADQ